MKIKSGWGYFGVEIKYPNLCFPGPIESSQSPSWFINSVTIEKRKWNFHAKGFENLVETHGLYSKSGRMRYPVDSAEAGRARKKGAWVRAWLVVDSAGEAEVVEAGKHAIMQRTGLPGRDLRMLDPALSYPSTVLGRERAIVVNLENIRSIITSREMIFQNSKDPLLTPFVDKIQQVFRHRQAVLSTQVFPLSLSLIVDFNLIELGREVMWCIVNIRDFFFVLQVEFVLFCSCSIWIRIELNWN